MTAHNEPASDTGRLPREGCSLSWHAIGAGTPVLFIHGTAAAVWGELPARTARFARTIQYDRRGFGASSAPPVATLSLHASDAAALLQSLTTEPAVIVGWSIGGIIACELAASHPGRVRGLVLLEPPFWAKKHPSLALLNGVLLSILLGLLAGPARGGRRFSRWVFREREGGQSLDRLPADLRARIEANAAAIGVEIRAGTGEHLTAAQIGELRTPTTILAGDRSRPFFEQCAQRLAGLIPGARLVPLAGANHLMQVDHATAIVEAIREQIADTVPPPPSAR